MKYLHNYQYFVGPPLGWIPISLSYPLPLPLPLSFDRSRESKGCPNSHFDRGGRAKGKG